MALTDAQKAAIRRALGWSARFAQFDSRLDQAMSAISTLPEAELQITDTLANNGILANIDDIQSRLRAQYTRLKADQVGTIKLNPREQRQLRSEGSRYVLELARLLGVEVRDGGLFGGARKSTFAGFGGNYIGK